MTHRGSKPLSPSFPAAMKIPLPRGQIVLSGHQPVLLTGWNFFHRAVQMSETLAHRTKNKLAKIYAAGIVVFSAGFGFLTMFFIFLAHLK